MSGGDNGLSAHLRRRIALEGPLSVAAYMTEALTHPRFGYYATRDPLGAAGDFTTAPEISQTFGELIGLWLGECWHRLGAPKPFALVELGPGRGTLMQDALRATRIVPGFREAALVHLVETSPALRTVQRAVLGPANPVWLEDVARLPEMPALVVANELFDALPIHQLERGPSSWHERRIDWSDEYRFHFVRDPSPSPLAALVPPELGSAPEQTVVEVSPASVAYADALARHLGRYGGAALVVDYGPAESVAGPTFQAVRRHARADPLEAPGSADLTAHVDFVTLLRVGREAGAAGFGPVEQGRFLRRLGIEARLAVLAARAEPAVAAGLDAGVRRLIDPSGMGSLFKVIAFATPALGTPPGFEDEEETAP